MNIEIFLYFYFINSISCIYTVIPNNGKNYFQIILLFSPNIFIFKANLPNQSIGLLNSDQFNFTSLDPSGSKNVPPLTIGVQAILFGKSLKFKLEQLQGALSNSSLSTKIYSIMGQMTNMTLSATQKTVINRIFSPNISNFAVHFRFTNCIQIVLTLSSAQLF